MLPADLDLVHISMGDIGDDLAVVRDRLTQHDRNYGFIIDGFPRDPREEALAVRTFTRTTPMHIHTVGQSNAGPHWRGKPGEPRQVKG
jgi:adenylate kinase family enzyme